MSDLDKMMDKLKKTKKKKKDEEETEQQDQDEDQEEQEDDEDQEEKDKTKEQEKKVNVNEEVAILQNDGIFRREVLGVLRELINVETIKAQALIDLNKLIGGALNGKGK